MANEVELPALDGRDPLGFLAALGVLRLLAEQAGAVVRLRFSDRTAAAIVVGEYADVDAVASALGQVATATDGPIPDVSPEFPAKAGRNADPMRVQYAELRALHERARTPAEGRWLSVLLTDLAVDNQQRAALTPYSAPSGKMNLRTFFEKPAAAVRSDTALIREALVGWRRVEGVTGEYLDHRVLRSAADDPLGRAGQEAGVPGATWLAIMALPLLRLTGDGRNMAAATCWYRVAGRREPIMVWPLWCPALDVPAVQALIEHPVLRPRLNDHGLVAIPSNGLNTLGVFMVCGAERQPVHERKFAGVIAPATVVVAEKRR
jgi:hypothetical protein